MRELLMARGKEEGITLCVLFYPLLVFWLCPSYMLPMLLWPHVLPAVILHPLEQALPNLSLEAGVAPNPMLGSRHACSHDLREV